MTELNHHKESQEMYLKTIHKIFQKQNSVRATDICEETGYKKSSVSRAVSQLEEGEYIVRDKEKYITLTKKGQQTTEFVEERYNACFQILMFIGLDEVQSEKFACELEHIIDNEVYDKMKAFLNTVKSQKIVESLGELNVRSTTF